MNEGESPAINIKIPGIPNIPLLEPKTHKLVIMTRQNNEIGFYKSVKSVIKFEYNFEEYSVEYNSIPYIVELPIDKNKIFKVRYRTNGQ